MSKRCALCHGCIAGHAISKQIKPNQNSSHLRLLRAVISNVGNNCSESACEAPRNAEEAGRPLCGRPLRRGHDPGPPARGVVTDPNRTSFHCLSIHGTSRYSIPVTDWTDFGCKIRPYGTVFERTDARPGSRPSRLLRRGGFDESGC